jgi:hypothetical protein
MVLGKFKPGYIYVASPTRTGISANEGQIVRFEVFTAVNMKNGVFWDVTP